MKLLQNPKAGLTELIRFRVDAVGKEHWETVRECDSFRAIVCKDKALLLKVYFGTPYQSYRQRLLKDFGESVVIPESFVWQIGEGSKLGKREYDVFRAVPELKPGQLKYRLLRTLASDFYRPFRVTHLFSEVYPTDCFRLHGSASRIHEGVKVLRLWLKGHRLPLLISERRGQYQLASTGRE